MKGEILGFYPKCLGALQSKSFSHFHVFRWVDRNKTSTSNEAGGEQTVKQCHVIQQRNSTT